jgi:hypothetical protein
MRLSTAAAQMTFPPERLVPQYATLELLTSGCEAAKSKASK